METRIHYFFALKIPDNVKETLHQYLEAWKKEFAFSRWVHPMDLHITLAFLGGAEEEKLASSIKKVKHALQDEKPFPISIHQLGVFGNSESPRVFWADMEENSTLQELRFKVFSACEEAGFTLETRPFRPHITLARKWKGELDFQQEMLHKWHEFKSNPLSFEATEVVLYKTNLHQTPKYEPITVFPLQASNK